MQAKVSWKWSAVAGMDTKLNSVTEKDLSDL